MDSPQIVKGQQASLHHDLARILVCAALVDEPDCPLYDRLEQKGLACPSTSRKAQMARVIFDPQPEHNMIKHSCLADTLLDAFK